MKRFGRPTSARSEAGLDDPERGSELDFLARADEPDDEARRRAATARIQLAGPGSATLAAVAVAIVFLIVATLKPWGPDRAPSVLPSGFVPVVDETPGPPGGPPTARDLVSGFCLDP